MYSLFVHSCVIRAAVPEMLVQTRCINKIHSETIYCLTLCFIQILRSALIRDLEWNEGLKNKVALVHGRD